VLAESDNVAPVSDAARQLAAAPPAASLIGPQHACDEQKGRLYRYQLCILSTSGRSRQGTSAKKVVMKSDTQASTDAAAALEHDPCLLQMRPEEAQGGNLRYQKSCREKLQVRFCVLTAPLFMPRGIAKPRIRQN
jgi:hypothetical protein